MYRLNKKRVEYASDSAHEPQPADYLEDVSSVKPKKKYTSIELFSGAGGMALGLENAGFDVKALVEFDRHACATLRHNKPEWNVIHEDVAEVSQNKMASYVDLAEEIDLLAGGYPCQAFSFAGKRGGLSDARGTLFYHYAKILKEVMPKIFIAENVRGLVSHDKGSTLSTMLSVFEDCGYIVSWKILKATNYGVAQKRERIFIVGVRKDIYDKIGLPFRFPKEYGYTPTLKDALKDVPPSPGAKYPESKRKVLEMVPPGGCWRDLPDEVAMEYMGKSYYLGGGKTGMARRISWDEPSLTLTCSPAQKQTERCHPDETRPFTIREYARIQSFPDDWAFDCSMSNAYKQIGNAVPVNMAKAVGLSVVAYLNKLP